MEPAGSGRYIIIIPKGNIQSNVDRFNGFADDYNQYRPAAPSMVVDIISRYLGRRPHAVADLGCGTGLSTLIWRDEADKVTGIEPNPDMIGRARQKLPASDTISNVTFLNGFSNSLPFEDESVDVITCSQSFHWMEPASTLREAGRVLVPGGIFAAFDCDWPPMLQWQAEDAYVQLLAKADNLLDRKAPAEHKATKWNKEGHLGNLRSSRQFCYTREILFHNTEACDAKRYFGLALSQGGVQTVLKLGWTDLDSDIETFKHIINDAFQGNILDILFSYRMRLGVK